MFHIIVIIRPGCNMIRIYIDLMLTNSAQPSWATNHITWSASHLGPDQCKMLLSPITKTANIILY